MNQCGPSTTLRIKNQFMALYRMVHGLHISGFLEFTLSEAEVPNLSLKKIKRRLPNLPEKLLKQPPDHQGPY